MSARGFILTLLASSLPCVALAQTRAPTEEPTHLLLEWNRTEAAADCPAGDAVSADVEARLRNAPLPASWVSRIRIKANVDRTDAGYSARLSLLDDTGKELGTRDVESSATTCDSLARAGALAIVLLMDAEAPRPETPPASPAKPCPPPPPPPAPAPPPAPLPPRGPSGSAHVGGLVAWGVLPEAAPGASMRVQLDLPSDFQIGLRTLFLPEQTLRTAAADVGLGLTAATLGGCYRLSWDQHFSWSTCASFGAGVVHVAVFEPVPLEPGDRSWWALLPGTRFGFELSPVVLELGAEAVLPLLRRDFRLEAQDGATSESLFQAPAVGAMGTLELGVVL